MQLPTALRSLRPGRGRAPGLASRLARLGVAGAWLAALACALPGRPVPVLPEVFGVIHGERPAPDARLRLVLMHRDTPSLHARQEVAIGPDGAFRFEPIALDVAGHEFSKHYRVYLHLQAGATDRVVWRADVSRLAAPAPIPLDCALDRPLALGEPCRVRDPLRQPWLLAEGRASYDRLCARCHGADGRGPAARDRASGAGADAGSPGAVPPDLTRIAARHGGRFDPDRVAAWIEGRTLPAGHARGDMPIWGERLSSAFAGYADRDALIGATLDPLVAHLESLQQGAAPLDAP